MTRQVLIVEDSLTQAHQLRALVAESGDFAIAGTAQTGAEGIRLFEQLRPDLVLLDVVMPVLDGLSCLRAIRALDSQVKVVLISAVGSVDRTVEEARRLGVQEIITKPYDPEVVRAALKKIFVGD